MINRSFISVLIVTSAFTLVFGQTPEAKKEKEKAPRTFAWTFDGDGGYLGVQTVEVTSENFAKFGLREVRGVAVDKVFEKSPAAAAGLQVGDVILRVNGEDITSVRKLSRLISETSPDHQVKISIARNGSEQELNAKLGKRPNAFFGDGNFEFKTSMPFDKLKELPEMKDFPMLKDLPKGDFQFKEMPMFKNFPKGEFPQVYTTPDGKGQVFTWHAGGNRQIGVGITPLTKQLAAHFGVDGGALVNDVRENSPAARAGLKAGDIIVEANGKAVKGDFDLIRTINEKKDGDVQITFVRDRSRQTVNVTPEPGKDGGFFFKTDQENGLTVTPSPGVFKMIQPGTPAAPMVTPAPMTLFGPGRIV